MQQLIEYRKRVERLAHARTGEGINNGSFDHAAIIIEQMFKSAESQIGILTNNLNARVYAREAILEEAKMFLAQGDRSARILLESTDDAIFREHPFFEHIRNNDNVEVRRVPASLRAAYDYHFLIMDNDSYRYEPTKDGPSAVAAFGDHEGAKNLSKIFDIIWGGSALVDHRSPSRAAQTGVVA